MEYSKTKLRVKLDFNQGDTVPDALLVSYVESKIERAMDSEVGYTHIIGSSSLLATYRLAVACDKISTSDIIVMDEKGTTSSIDEFGRLTQNLYNADVDDHLRVEVDKYANVHLGS